MANSLVASDTNKTAGSISGIGSRLVLTVGSNAGREAPLQAGYYMIGRLGECQIRPKSRSVSRRHCLLLVDESGLQVFDLASASGTRVNGIRLREKTWHRLRHGDHLRLGKVVFEILLPGQAPAGADPAASRKLSVAESPEEGFSHQPHGDPLKHGEMSVASNSEANEMPVGEAWHDVDIAGFLETEDDADRERRYSSIRSSTDSGEADEDSSDQFDTTIEADLDVFDDSYDPGTNESSMPTTPGAKSSFPDDASGRPSKGEDASSSSVAKSSDRSQKRSQRSPSKPRDLAGSAPRRSSKRFSLPTFSTDADRWKKVGVSIVLLCALIGLGVSASRFYSGQDVRVLQNID